MCRVCVDCRLLLANSLTHSLTYKHCWIITIIQSPTSNMAITYSPVRQLHKSTSLFIAQGCETLHLLPHILLFISYSPVRQLYNFVTHLFICAQHLLISQPACFLHQNQCLTFNFCFLKKTSNCWLTVYKTKGYDFLLFDIWLEKKTFLHEQERGIDFIIVPQVMLANANIIAMKGACRW